MNSRSASTCCLRWPGNFSLPFIDQLDERIIDFGTSQSLNTHHYPPGIVMLNYLMLRLFHDTDKPPGSVVRQVRLVSVAAGIGTTLVIALLGYHALNPAAGLAAATLYAITPCFRSWLVTPPQKFILPSPCQSGWPWWAQCITGLLATYGS